MTLHATITGSGADLVLLHGWGLHAGVWDEVAAHFAPRWRVHAIDLPGHGESRDAVPATFDEAASQVAAAIPAGAVLCGWSLGGLFAQRIAVREAARLRRLVLVSSTPCFVARTGWQGAMQPQTLAQFAAGLAADRDRTLRDFIHLNALHGTQGRPAVRALWNRLLQRPAPTAATLQTSLAWLRDTDLRAGAGSITSPTLVMHGARDALCPLRAGAWLAEAIPDARLDVIDDAAHLPFFTHRERFAAALESFLA